ncbi:Ada metal-binding domain-containing protein [Paucilactobacillus suebicus]|uniref:Methylphosphotriester-DNA alkyltransferase n=1 Tax=Paucilactobacillus suebicus DSM 5007 = KCTC 3549 TaxID=1423807 RepID=A0A0R1W5A5_9LACO|nr:Ada metal-binding domain-containing protein [Paucilactobacillus suebicus]KRM12690.1 methylphosphotriester-DNA alkyltransferase [Paucilactobacillus suebicus DSM 5007 = KCTC 3549]
MKPNQQQWQAIVTNDGAFDNSFCYAVKTTGIFCRPSCPSKLPNQDNVAIYQSTADAIKAGYRPCKRCRPLQSHAPSEIWLAEVNQIIDDTYNQDLNLQKLANMVHTSPSYLRHEYKHLAGLTPQQKINNVRLCAAQNLLLNSNESVTNIGFTVGITSTAYFIKQFRDRFGISPGQYRSTHTARVLQH